MSYSPDSGNDSPIPNVFYNKLQGLLSPEEWSVLTYACRRILGFAENRKTVTAQISLSMFCTGKRASKGGPFLDYGTGLNHATVTRALILLEDSNILTEIFPHDPVTNTPATYKLNHTLRSVDIEALADRREQRLNRNSGKTVNARKEKALKRMTSSVRQNGSDNEGFGIDGAAADNQVAATVNSVIRPYSVAQNRSEDKILDQKPDTPILSNRIEPLLLDRTRPVLSNRTPLRNQEETKKKPSKSIADASHRQRKKSADELTPEQKIQHRDLMRALYERTGKIPDGAAQGDAVKWLLLADYSPPDCVECLDSLLATSKPEYRVSWLNVKKMIGNYLLRRQNGANGNGVKNGNGTHQSQSAIASQKRATDFVESIGYYDNLIAEAYSRSDPDAAIVTRPAAVGSADPRSRTRE